MAIETAAATGTASSVVSAAPDSAEITIPATDAASSRPDGEVRASPIARRLAREQGIDLAMVTGTGPGGRVVEQDILEFAVTVASAAQLPGVSDEVAAIPAGGVRSSPIARRLARERGIDLAQVTGTGPEGRIVELDILEYTPVAPASDLTATVIETATRGGRGTG